jgi:hypothetical protein
MGGLVDYKGRWRAIDFQSIEPLPPKSDRAAYAAAIESHTKNINAEKEKLASVMSKNTP